MKFEDYAIIVSPLSEEDGGGYLASFPDLPGCISDGETPEEAIEEARDAFAAWTASVLQDKGELPKPKTYSGQYVQRIPKTLHLRLAQRAQAEGVSLNQLSATILAEGLARV